MWSTRTSCSPIPPPICFLAADYVEPGSLVENEVDGATTYYDASATNDEQAGQLFGMDAEPVTDGALLDKRRRVETIITKDLEVIAQCQASKSCPAPAQKLIDLSLEGANRSGRARVGVINRVVDLAISPVSDETQCCVSDHWSDPLETLRSNRSDCEDYTIV
jgi:predicted transglutaminase-like cysteine proteinase